MAKFIKGDIVVLPFPFSDLTGSKRRPALVLADLPEDDILLCQITSQHSRDSNAIAIFSADFISGYLPADSFIKPYRIFTADKNIIIRRAGTLKYHITDSAIQKIVDLLQL